MVKVAIHQPNCVPWFPFFYKMAMSDTLVILSHCQFEKNGFQNRFKYKDKWITKPVKNGKDLICNKTYADGQDLLKLNMKWIEAIKDTLDIQTHIVHDRQDWPKSSNKSKNLADLVQRFGDTYVTNPEAFDKYLDRSEFDKLGIDIVSCVVPKHLRISIFEAFEIYGVEGLKKQLPKRG